MASSLNLKGLTVEIGGDTSNLQTALKNVNSEITNLQQNLRSINTALKLDPSNVDALVQKQKLLSDAIAETKEKLEILKEAQRQADETIAKGGEVDQQAYRNLATEIARTESSLNNYQSELKTTETALNSVGKETDEATKETDELGSEMSSTAKETEGAVDSSKKLSDGYSVLKNVVANLITEALNKLKNVLKDVTQYVWEAGTTYEQSMSKVQALSGATGDEMERLGEKAVTSAEKTIYTTKECADAFSYMALAGWDTGEMIDGLDGVLNLAAASQMDLARASDIVTDDLSAFGLTAADSQTLVDKMAYAMSNANTDTDQLGEAYKNVAAISTQLGYSLDDTTATLMVMANAGIKGGEAGTALASIMTRLGNNVSGCRDMLQEYGVEVYDSEGNVKSLSSILEGMRGVWSTLTDEQKANLSYTVAGKTAQAELMTVLGDSSGSFVEYANGLATCNGLAEQMVGTMNDNILGDVEKLKSKVNALATELLTNLSPSIREIIQGITAWLNTADVKAIVDQITLSLQNLLANAASKIPAAIESITTAIQWVIQHIDAIGTAVKAFLVVWAAVKAYNIGKAIFDMITGLKALVTSTQAVEMATKLASAAQAAFNAIMNANPIALAVTAVAALTAGLVALVAGLSNAAYKSFYEQIQANSAAVTAFSAAVRGCQPSLIDTTKILSETGRTMSELDSAISETENAVTAILKTALSEQRQLRQDELASIAQYNQQLEALQQEKLNTYRQQMTTELMKINAESNQITQEGAAQYVRNLQAALEQANAISEQSYNSRLAEIYNFHQAQGTLDSQAYQQDVANARAAYQQELADSQSFYNQGISALTEHSREWVQVDAEKWNNVLAAAGSSKKKYAQALSEIDQDNANAFLSMYNEAKKSGAQISAQTEATAKAMIAAFDGLPKSMQESGKAALLGIVSGMKDEMPSLENASEMTAQEIVDTLKTELDIHSPSKVTSQIGGYVVEGLAEGMQKKDSWLGSRIKSFASGIVSKIKSALQIGSPSKVIRDEIGQWIPAGLGEGIEENADAAVDPMKKLVSDLSTFDGMKITNGISNTYGTGSQNGDTSVALMAKLDELSDLLRVANKKSVFIDKNKLVGAIASDMDHALGDIANRKAVGAV